MRASLVVALEGFLTKTYTMSTYKDLLAFKKAFALAMKIFETSKHFPKEETYSLTDQVRKSSRSVCANFAEAFRRRKYPAHFLGFLTVMPKMPKLRFGLLFVCM